MASFFQAAVPRHSEFPRVPSVPKQLSQSPGGHWVSLGTWHSPACATGCGGGAAVVRTQGDAQDPLPRMKTGPFPCCSPEVCTAGNREISPGKSLDSLLRHGSPWTPNQPHPLPRARGYARRNPVTTVCAVLISVLIATSEY